MKKKFLTLILIGMFCSCDEQGEGSRYCEGAYGDMFENDDIVILICTPFEGCRKAKGIFSPYIIDDYKI